MMSMRRGGIEMRLVWVSRHELTEENWRILRKAFGLEEIEVVQYTKTVEDIRELIEFADQHGADAFVVVLPPHLIQQLLQATDKPVYRFVVEREVLPNGEAKFTPIGLERIVRVEIVTERVVSKGSQ